MIWMWSFVYLQYDKYCYVKETSSLERDKGFSICPSLCRHEPLSKWSPLGFMHADILEATWEKRPSKGVRDLGALVGCIGISLEKLLKNFEKKSWRKWTKVNLSHCSLFIAWVKIFITHLKTQTRAHGFISNSVGNVDA